MEKPPNERESPIFDHFLAGSGLVYRFHTASARSRRSLKKDRYCLNGEAPA